MLYNFFVYKKYQKSFLARIGLEDQRVIKSRPYLIWIHAISVGETKAVVQLARNLKAQFSNCQLIISSVTETGHAEAKRCMPFADQHIYMPFDFTPITRSLVRKLSPNLVILCESDLWYNFLCYAKKEGAQIALVNGKLSERSMRRFKAISFFSKKLFKFFDLIAVQNPLYQKRFIEAGANPEKIRVTGNLKFDEEYPQLSKEEVMQWKDRLGIRVGQVVLAIGSTHDEEELIFIRVLKKLWDKSDLKVLLVPRHPERFKEVSRILKAENVPFILYTELGQRTGGEKVILIDTMGMLRMCYQLSDLALVGGSFTPKVGGHNILEPCWYGKPVFFGPYMHTQDELVDLVKSYGAGQQLTEINLLKTLEDYVNNPEKRYMKGKKGEELVVDIKGATKRTLVALNSVLHYPN